jgi:transposase-like protein
VERDSKRNTSRFQEIPVEYGNRSEAAQGFVDQAGSSTNVQCPSCGSKNPRRLERKGLLQTKIYPLFGYYPWMCGACKETFLMRKRYRRKAKKKEYVE